jgi:phosphopantothenoylcysteine synthetase/decarboxylase
MNVLVTAGNTLVPIDRVRCITNIFTGRTGSRIALEAHQRGHQVTLLTSHPDVLRDLQSPLPQERWTVLPYTTFDDLQEKLAHRLTTAAPDAVIHSAAVSDYSVDGIYSSAPGTAYRPETGHWEADAGPPSLQDMAAGKVKSDAPELWLRLVRTPKLIDRMRSDWGFRGVLVKFKLEVGVSEEQLLYIAERSRLHSSADLMVANTLEGAGFWAFLGPLAGSYQRVSRRALAERLLEAVEAMPKERCRG